MSSDLRPDDALRLASFGNGFFFSFFSSPVILFGKVRRRSLDTDGMLAIIV